MGLWITPSEAHSASALRPGWLELLKESISKSLALRCFGWDPATGVMQLKAVEAAGCLVRHDSMVTSRVIRKFRSNKMDVECESASIWAEQKSRQLPSTKTEPQLGMASSKTQTAPS